MVWGRPVRAGSRSPSRAVCAKAGRGPTPSSVTSRCFCTSQATTSTPLQWPPHTCLTSGQHPPPLPPSSLHTHTHTHRDQNFMVTTVTTQDVIHAGSKLIPAIFKVPPSPCPPQLMRECVCVQISSNQQACPSLASEVLILTEGETEKERWVNTLEELHKAARQSPNQMVGAHPHHLTTSPPHHLTPSHPRRLQCLAAGNCILLRGWIYSKMH